MLANKDLFIQNNEVLEERFFKKLGAVVGSIPLYGVGPVIGGWQKKNLKSYQQIQDKLTGVSFRKSSPSIFVGILIGLVPIVSMIMNLLNQVKIDNIRKDIIKRLDVKKVDEVLKLKKQIEKGKTFSQEDVDRLLKLEEELYKSFNHEEVKKIISIVKNEGKKFLKNKK